MKSVTVHEAKTHLSKLLIAASDGEEIEVRRGSVPVARIVPLPRTARRRPRVGEVTSEPVACSADCFAPLRDEEAAEWSLP